MTQERLRFMTVFAVAACAYLCVPEHLLPLESPPTVIPATSSDLAKREPSAYLASPLGFSEAGRLFYQSTLLPLARDTGFKTLDPWTLTPQALINAVLALPYGEERRARWQQLNQVIGRNNAEAIQRCDIVIAVLDGVDVDSGTASEIGYAAALGKTILGYRGDFRLSADNEGSRVNLQVEYFIRQSGGQIVTSVDLLRQALLKIRRGFRAQPR
jgi:nucleoside 2-deoxyribosyltransferase